MGGSPPGAPPWRPPAPGRARPRAPRGLPAPDPRAALLLSLACLGGLLLGASPPAVHAAVRSAQSALLFPDSGWGVPPVLSWLTPPKGHIKGGTLLTLYGARFKKSPFISVRFSVENEFSVVPGTYVSESEITCVAPERTSAQTAQVTASNDGITFSGYPLVYTQGSGTFLYFLYDNSDAGCFQCLNSDPNAYTGLNPNFIGENWKLDNRSGPYAGGTLVTITASGLNWPPGVAPYDLVFPGSIQTYNGPVGGPGTPHPFKTDPNSVGNGPPVSGTFYPGMFLKCQFTCFIDVDGSGVMLQYTSAWIDPTWHDYTRITCESPPMPLPHTGAGVDIPDTSCALQVSNNQQTFDVLAGSFANFTYQDHPPTVTHISTSQSSPWSARGPFQGNTELTIIGTNFLPSKYLTVKFGGLDNGNGTLFMNDTSHIVGEPGGRVRYISSNMLIATSPVFGPSAQREQYPPGTLDRQTGAPMSAGAGALLTVTAFSAAGGIAAVQVVTGGRGYAVPPRLEISGGGGCCVNLTAVLTSGVVSAVLVGSGGLNYNRGLGAAAVALLSGAPGDGSLHIVTAINVLAGGNGYLAPPDVTFECPGCAACRLSANALACSPTCQACFVMGPVSADGSETSRGGPVAAFSPGIHATARAVLGDFDPNCLQTYGSCQAQGSVVRVEVLTGGAYYSSPPAVLLAPQRPTVSAVSRELVALRNTLDPARVGAYSMQGKSAEEMDPQVDYTSLNVSDKLMGAPVNSGPEPLFGLERTQLDGDGVPCAPGTACEDLRHPEGRGGLLPPRGEAWTDGSIKPGHQVLIRVSNNYNKFGADRGADQSGPLTHVGVRDTTTNPPTGYWIWSQQGTSPSDLNKCRVSNNPPVQQYGVIQGHGLDAHLGLGTADDVPTTSGIDSGFLYLDGSSVVGAPGLNATAIAIMSPGNDSIPQELAALLNASVPWNSTFNMYDTHGLAAGELYIEDIQVTNPGMGYNSPPTVSFTGGGGGFGARATAVLSAGQVVAVLIDPENRGRGYTSAPQVVLTATDQLTEYDASAVLLFNGTLALPLPGAGGAPNVGSNGFNIDQTSNSIFAGGLAAGSSPDRGTNYAVGHGAFPGHPGNLNLGYPKSDCLHFFYGDIYVSPSGSDSTGLGTAGRPYRTLQKCIDAALTDPRAHYVYKRADGGDPDPAVPNGRPRCPGGVCETAGERVDNTPAAGRNFGTGRDQGYTGRPVTNRAGRSTGWPYMYGAQGRWGHDTGQMIKGIGYFVNRDRCVLKDGVYAGEGNRELQPRGRIVQLWAENAGAATVDCGGQSLGRVAFQADPNGGEEVTLLGSVTLQGVTAQNCNIRSDPQPNYREYYPGRPGPGPGAPGPGGSYCYPGATGCQFRRPPDGTAAGQ